MQQCIFDVFDIPWILQELLFSQTSFWRESFLNISNHLPDSSFAQLTIRSFDLCRQLSWMPEYPVLTGLAGKMSNFLSSLTDFIEIRRVLASSTSSTLKLLKFIFTVSDLIMPKLVFLMTVHEAHKEYNSLIDQIRAKYELLDSGECGSVGTPAFNAECSKLAHLMARMSKLCKHLNLPMPKELHRPLHFKH